MLSFYDLCVHSTCEHSSVDCKQESLLSPHLLDKNVSCDEKGKSKETWKTLETVLSVRCHRASGLFGSPDYKKGCLAG